MTQIDIDMIQNDIKLYQNGVDALEKVKQCSDVSKFECKYIDRNIAVIKRYIMKLQAKIDLDERDQ